VHRKLHPSFLLLKKTYTGKKNKKFGRQQKIPRTVIFRYGTVQRKKCDYTNKKYRSDRRKTSLACVVKKTSCGPTVKVNTSRVCQNTLFFYRQKNLDWKKNTEFEKESEILTSKTHVEKNGPIFGIAAAIRFISEKWYSGRSSVLCKYRFATPFAKRANLNRHLTVQIL